MAYLDCVLKRREEIPTSIDILYLDRLNLRSRVRSSRRKRCHSVVSLNTRDILNDSFLNRTMSLLRGMRNRNTLALVNSILYWNVGCIVDENGTEEIEKRNYSVSFYYSTHRAENICYEMRRVMD